MPHAHSTDPYIRFIPGVPVMLEGCTFSQDENQSGVYLHWRSLDNKPLKTISFVLHGYDVADEMLAFSSFEYSKLTADADGCMGKDQLIPLDIADPRWFRVELTGVIFADGKEWKPEKETIFRIGLTEGEKAVVHIDEKQEQQARKQGKNSKSKRMIAGLLLVLLALLIAGASIFLVLPEKRYQDALALAKQGQYDQASQAFAALGDYKDAPDMVLGVYVMQGEALLSKGDREGALAAYRKAGDDDNIAQKIDEIQYQNAASLLEKGQLEQAYTLFASIKHYQDADQQAIAIRTTQARQALEARDFDAAVRYLGSTDQDANGFIAAQAASWLEAGRYEQAAAACQYLPEDDNNRQLLYRCAKAASEKKDYALSVSLFTALSDYQDSALLLQQDRLARAEDMMAQGQYQAAAQEFEALGDYGNAALRLSDARYAMALVLLEGGDYQGAKAAFQAIPGHSDSDQMILEADYRAGSAALNRGDYAQAISLFSVISGYKDSGELLKAARYGDASQKIGQGDYQAAIQALIALSDYQDSESLLKKARYGYAQQLSAQGDLAQAYEYFLLAGDYADAAAQATEHAFAQGYSLQQQGSYEEALGWYARCPQHPDVPQQKFLLGEAFLLQQQYDQALSLLKTVAHMPGAGEYLYLIAQNAYQQQDFATAYTAYMFAGEYQDSPQQAAALMADMKVLASQLLAQGDYARADAIFETLALGGFITDESLQAEFFAFLTAPGRRFTLGNYPQAADGTLAPVVWRVLDCRDGRLTLLSDKLLGCARYDSYSSNSVDAYLKTLGVMFQGGERRVAGEMYILTQEEVKQYLPTDADRTAQPTAYAQSRAVEDITYRTEGVWTATIADNFNFVIYDHVTGRMIPRSLQFKTNYVRPAMQVNVDQALYQLLSDPMNGYQFLDGEGKPAAFTSRYQ